ncbi:M23 family metallopeptidase [Parahaliea maris]|uniref:M23 family metallopeptidase n=1 Tax=Parahaliea maris TaxID=2716870 RepID=A0A5C8ZTV8_9GAMM|nr:M23 family metallopeptidase [Parahaliea maris]TXS91933.1 M23 family metallopeptidase [Parahaliea maris]
MPSRIRTRAVAAVLAIASLWHGSALASCLDWQGSLRQGGLVWARVTPGTGVQLAGEALDVLADGTVFAGFGRDAPATAALKLTGNTACSEILTVVQRDYDIQRVEGVPQRTVTPSPEHRARIAREQELVGAAKARNLQRDDLLEAALTGFQWPVTGPISGVYGSQRIYNGEPRSPHYGVDVAVATGTIVRAPAAGVVTLAEPDLFYSGGTIILDHGYRLSSSFLHLSKVRVAVGQEVAPGDIIGEVGATGRATGPHLDWRMSWRGHRIDPQLLVPPMAEPAALPGG